MTPSYLPRASPRRRRRSPPLVPLLPPTASLATLVSLLLSQSVNLKPAVASDRSLCFKMPPADTLVVKPELMTDAVKVWTRETERASLARLRRRPAPPLPRVKRDKKNPNRGKTSPKDFFKVFYLVIRILLAPRERETLCAVSRA